MSRARQFEQKLKKDAFYQERARWNAKTEVEEPCTPGERTPAYICSGDGRSRLPLGVIDVERPSVVPSREQRRGNRLLGIKGVPMFMNEQLPRLGDPTLRPKPTLTFHQIKEARRLLALWKKWDEEGLVPVIKGTQQKMTKAFRIKHGMEPPEVTV